MPILRKSKYVSKAEVQRVNLLLVANNYPAIEEAFVSNIINDLGGGDLAAQQQVYEIISVALNFELIDDKGYEYTPQWL
jgi:hypothetical protein